MSRESVWIVRGVAPYRRKTSGVAPDGPKRPRVHVPRSWETDAALGGVDVPVTASSAEEAERRALESEYVEKIRGPTSKMKVIGDER